MTQKLLLADDSITMQRLVSLTFADENIEVISVGDGAAVTRRLKEIRPDIILVDVFLPGKNGYEICKMVKSDPQMKHVPVLLLVGTFEPLDPDQAQEVKADGHLTKPFESTVLINVVKDLLSKAPAHGEDSNQAVPQVIGAAVDGQRTNEPGETAAGSLNAADAVAGPGATTEPPVDAVTPPTAATHTEAAAATPSAPELELNPRTSEPALESHSSVAFAVSATAVTGNSHPVSEGNMDDLLELDLNTAPLDEQAHNSFLLTPILDIYTEPPAEALESETAPASVSTAVEETALEPVYPLENTPAPDVLTLEEAPAAEHPAAPMATAPVPAEALSEAWIEAVAQRVIEKLSDTVIREVAWEVVPELSELIIREQVKKNSKRQKPS